MKKVPLKTLPAPDDWQATTDDELTAAGVAQERWAALRAQQAKNSVFDYTQFMRQVLSQPTFGQQNMEWDEADTSSEIADAIRDGKDQGFVLLENEQYKFLKTKLFAYKPNVADSRLRQLRKDVDTAEDVTMTLATN